MSELSQEPGDHVLDQESHEMRRQRHAELALSTSEPSEKPTAIIIAGQPGAGKSALSERAEARFEKQGGAVVVDIDELRNSHPAYKDLGKANDRTAASLVQADASKWGKELTADAAEGKRNLIIDGTLKSPDKAEALSDSLRAQGYKVEVHAMAVRKEDSRLGILARYEDAKEKGDLGRWVPEKPANVHDEAYEGIRQSLDRLQSSDSVDKIEIHGRSLDGEKSTRLLCDTSKGDKSSVEALDAERARPRTKGEEQFYDQQRARVVRQMKARDPKLRDPMNKAVVDKYGSKKGIWDKSSKDGVGRASKAVPSKADKSGVGSGLGGSKAPVQSQAKNGGKGIWEKGSPGDVNKAAKPKPQAGKPPPTADQPERNKKQDTPQPALKPRHARGAARVAGARTGAGGNSAGKNEWARKISEKQKPSSNESMSKGRKKK